MINRTLINFQKIAPPLATHVIKVSGEYLFSHNDGVKHVVLNEKGNKTRQSFTFGDFGWFVVHDLKVKKGKSFASGCGSKS